ncbi:6139_t:CDS:2 [Acaulospora colombiana]|uniref:6139_t:CDS:1 n=1 Tax=Acaulospora colombiana TaxID=27376 RepID=A0ACA9NMA5_9GLOM|nr:6139_t:CDS:2 [Acaulospora colombiana]
MVAPKGLPLGTYGLFAARDALTVAASFNAPAGVSARLRDSQFLKSHGISLGYDTSLNIAQILCPSTMQDILEDGGNTDREDWTGVRDWRCWESND